MRPGYILMGVILFLLAAGPSLAASVGIEQSGADSGTVMKGQYFTITVSGLSGSGSVSLIDTPSGFSSEEGTTKSFSEGTDSVTWTTAKISLTQSAITLKASVSVQGSPSIAESSSFDVVLPPSINLAATPEEVSVNRSSSYSVTLNVQNLGGTSAKSISFSASGTGMSASCPTISSIAAGASSSATCTVTASTAGTITTAFTAEPSNCESKSDSISVTVTNAGGNQGGNSNNGNTGGAGGAGIVSQWVKEIKLNDSDLNRGQALKQVKANYRISFNVRGLGHTVSVLNVTNNTATIEVASTPQVATFSVGQSKQFDVDGDGYYDIYIMLDSIDSGMADITLKSVYEKVPSNGDVSNQVPAGPSGQQVITNPAACTEGAKRCSGFNVESCINGRWSATAVCSGGCNENTFSCNPYLAPTESQTPAYLYGLIVVVIVAVALLIVFGKKNKK